ncbi:MAG: Gfo/Idh/MocA family oxidoreductase [Bacteroidota bacterium]
MSNIQTLTRWGIIGCGDVCEVKSGPAFQKVVGSELVAVMRRNGTLAADYAHRHGVETYYDEADELIADPEVDAIYIATPPSSHCEYTLKAATAGKPVYVEKPMATSFEECQQMIRACQEAGVKLWVAYYRRRLAHFEKIRTLIREGVIGKVRLVNLELYQSPQPELVAAHQLKNWRVQPEISGGGYFFDLASHQLDLLDYWFGPIVKVSGLTFNQAALYEAEDIVSASWQHENGVMGSGIWCFSVSPQAARESCEIIGSKGVIRFQFFGSGVVRWETANGKEQVEFEMPMHIQQPLIESIMGEIQGKDRCPSDGVSGARTNWVMGQIAKNK